MEILLLGDSLFARYEGQVEPHIHVSLREKLPQLKIRNLAESGDNSFDLLDKLATCEVTGADLVFVWIAANDLATHKQVYLGEFQDNMRKVAETLLEHYTATQLVFLGPAPVDEEKQLYRTNRLVGAYSNMVERVAREYDISFVSMQAYFGHSSFPLKDILRGSLDDGLHFGRLGYTLLAQAIIDQIKTKS